MKKITADNTIFAMGKDNPPALEVDPGEIIEFSTKDCFSNQIQSCEELFESADWATINPATGPVFVKGTEPSDTLVVDILDITLADQGVMVAVPEMGALGDKIEESETKIIPLENGYARFNEKISLPVKPMIGVIGTAPFGEEIPNGTPGDHGGNMDTKHIVKGTRLYLPVFHPGGLLAIGDMHAVMGDGEVIICGVEAPGKALVKVDVIKGKTLNTPVLDTPDHFYVIASEKDLNSSASKTLDKTYEFLSERLPLSTNEVCMLMSIACDLQISQVVDPLITCRMAIPKNTFALYSLSFA